MTAGDSPHVFEEKYLFQNKYLGENSISCMIVLKVQEDINPISNEFNESIANPPESIEACLSHGTSSIEDPNSILDSWTRQSPVFQKAQDTYSLV
jgi:hypothetical protein